MLPLRGLHLSAVDPSSANNSLAPNDKTDCWITAKKPPRLSGAILVCEVPCP
jgi:hypothetical protein